MNDAPFTFYAITACLRRPKPMSPTNAELNSHIAAGTGTAVRGEGPTELERVEIEPPLREKEPPLPPTITGLNIYGGTGGNITGLSPLSWALAETELEKFNTSPLLTMTPTAKVPCF